MSSGHSLYDFFPVHVSHQRFCEAFQVSKGRGKEGCLRKVVLYSFLRGRGDGGIIVLSHLLIGLAHRDSGVQMRA